MKPFMSIVVICYNMNRELPRTIYSLSADFQRDISSDEYEVILVDNGSRVPPRLEDFSGIDIDLTIYNHENPTRSPVAAINMGINKSVGQVIGVFIDGARILSPRLLATAREGCSMSDRTIVGVRGRYLGSKFQRDSIAEGYDKTVEDNLLGSLGWQIDGYRLFGASVFDESSGPTWFDPIAETNALFLGRSLWQEINGFDPQFKSAGGGLVNLDTWKRLVELPDVSPIILVGEATFHQVHGGVATNGSLHTIDTFYSEYLQIRGHEFEIPQIQISLLGKLDPMVLLNEGFFKDNNSKAASSQRGNLYMTAILNLARRILSAPARRRLRVGYDLLKAVARHDPLKGIRHLQWEKAQSRILENHPLFDSEWYKMMYPNVVAAGYKPSWHYVRHGVQQRTLPGPIFDARWYLNKYPDVSESGVNPLLHYIFCGENEGRRIRIGSRSSGSYERSDEQKLYKVLAESNLFNAEWYVTQYRDVALSTLDPIIHYLRLGVLQKRNPSKDFDGVQYRRDYPAVGLSGINPLVHFESRGREEGRIYRPVSGERGGT